MRLESLIPDSTPQSQMTTCVRHGKAYVQILETAGQEQSDLVILGVRGHTALEMTLLGSVANEVVRRARCPVLTVRPADQP